VGSPPELTLSGDGRPASAPASTVDEYLAGLPEPSRRALEELRAVVRSAAPDAAETISYGIPTLKANGRLLVSYAAFSRHRSLFPASQLVRDELGDELKPFLSGKGTIRFDLDGPLPAALIRRVVAIRSREVAEARRR
jgi:uncharacterized protein YdhG (YjbR/CyaY superfamily)